MTPRTYFPRTDDAEAEDCAASEELANWAARQAREERRQEDIGDRQREEEFYDNDR